jgi:hypothetical protein
MPPLSYEALVAKVEEQRVMLALIESAARDASQKGAAFGGELRLALRVIAILEHKL